MNYRATQIVSHSDSLSKPIQKRNHALGKLSCPLNRAIRRNAKQKNHKGYIEAYISYQWENNFAPQLFITIEWTGLSSDYRVAENRMRHFKNVFLFNFPSLENHEKPNAHSLPRMIVFHERSVLENGRYAYHTHIHLGNLPPGQDSPEFILDFIEKNVSPRVKSLSRTKTEANRGVVVKPWIYDRHAQYNLKDYGKFKYHQDPDLVLDYRNSDLLGDDLR